MMVKMIRCEACSKEISEKAEICPGCGNPVPKKVKFKWYHAFFILFGLLAVLIGGGLIFEGISKGEMPGAAMFFATLFIIIGIFVIIAPFCRRR